MSRSSVFRAVARRQSGRSGAQRSRMRCCGPPKRRTSTTSDRTPRRRPCARSPSAAGRNYERSRLPPESMLVNGQPDHDPGRQSTRTRPGQRSTPVRRGPAGRSRLLKRQQCQCDSDRPLPQRRTFLRVVRRDSASTSTTRPTSNLTAGRTPQQPSVRSRTSQTASWRGPHGWCCGTAITRR